MVCLFFSGIKILYIIIPVLILGLSSYFGYFRIESILIWGGVLICFILYGTASYYLFKEEGDSKIKLVIRALTLPVGFIVLLGSIGILFWFVNLLVNN